MQDLFRIKKGSLFQKIPLCTVMLILISFWPLIFNVYSPCSS